MRSTNKLLDIVRANTQLKIYFSVNDSRTIKTLEAMSGAIGYERENGMMDYRSRLNVNDIGYYSANSDLAICWIGEDAGFTAYGGRWFGLRTSHHESLEEFERRENAPWPGATESTIVAQRSDEGARTFTQGTAQVVEPRVSQAELQMPLMVTPSHDSKWAKRLNEISRRRNESSQRT